MTSQSVISCRIKKREIKPKVNLMMMVKPLLLLLVVALMVMFSLLMMDVLKLKMNGFLILPARFIFALTKIGSPLMNLSKVEVLF